MLSVTPYLIRAYHEWMQDNNLTPHILVNLSNSNVIAPKPLIQQDKIVFNISNDATQSLIINNEAISFKARFSGKSQDVYVPINAILTIYAGENGEGMLFKDEDSNSKTENNKKPNLTILE